MIKPKKAIIDAVGYEAPLERENWVLKLDLNENVIGPSPRVIDALKSVSVEDIKFYPVYGELTNKIAEANNIDISMVLPTNGADEAINYIFDTFIEEDDEVLTVTPTFAMPKVYAKATGCKYIEVPYKEKWIFPIEDFLASINEKTKMVIITTPNSPTSETISEQDLQKIIDKAKHAIVLIDETYANYAEKSYTELIKENQNIIITKSMSKDFAIAGLRLGYIIANPEIIGYIKRIISPFSVNVLAAKAGVAAIEDKEYFEGVKKEIEESKKLLIEGLSTIAETIYPSETNFLCIDFGDKADDIYKKLLNSGIKVKYYKNDESLKNTFRMTVPSIEGTKIILETLKTEESNDLLIFDMDGVLIDTSNSYRLAIKGTFEHFAQQPISFERIQMTKNSGGLNNDWDLTEHLLQKSGFNIPRNEIIDKFQELYFGNGGSGFISNEEWVISPETLRELSKRYKIALFTGRPKQEAIFALENKGVKDLFYPIITMDDLPQDKQKPHPEGINRIKKELNPNKIYYFGDTPDDMIAAFLAGVNGIGVMPPQDKSDTLKRLLKEKGAVLVLEDIKQIAENIGV